MSSNVLYRYHDIDGDQIAVFTADIPGQGLGVNIRTSSAGCSLPLAEVSRLIAVLQDRTWAGPGFTQSNDESADA